MGLRARAGRVPLRVFYILIAMIAFASIARDFVRTADGIERQRREAALPFSATERGSGKVAETVDERACRRWDDSIAALPNGGPTCGR